MARITTQIVTSATAGDGVDSVQVTKTALDSASRAVSVTAVITAKPCQVGAKVFMYVVTSPQNLTATDAPALLVRQAYMKEFNWPLDSGKPVHVQTPPRIVQGGYLYVWFELPTVTVPGTLDVWAVEI